MRKYILEHKGKGLLYFIFGTIFSFAGVALTIVIQYIADIVVNNDTSKLLHMFLSVLCFFCGFSIIAVFYTIAKNHFCESVLISLRKSLFQSLMRKNIAEYLENDISYYESVYHNDLKILEQGLVARFDIILNLVEIFISLSYAFLQNPHIAIILLFVSIIGIVVPTFTQKILQNSESKMMEQASFHTRCLRDGLGGFETFKAYQREENMLKVYRHFNENYGRSAIKSKVFKGLVHNSTNTIVISLQLLLIAISGAMVFYNQLPLSFITVIIGLSSSVTGAMSELIGALVEKKSGDQVCKKVFQLIDEYDSRQIVHNISYRKRRGNHQSKEQLSLCPSDYTNSSSGSYNMESNKSIDFNERIKVDNLSFSYKEKKTLNNISMEFMKDKHYLVLGESGSGKSTLIKLLLQYYDNYEGNIYLDSQEIRKLEKEEYRRLFAVIPQSPFIFNDTLRNNITLFSDFDDTQVKDAIDKAGLADFYERQDEGLDTVLGENGKNLSGGERQRVSMARAFLYNRSIWILDEATANLDRDMASQIESTVFNIPGITVIMIAHHYNEDLLKKCDKVYHITKPND